MYASESAVFVGGLSDGDVGSLPAPAKEILPAVIKNEPMTLSSAFTVPSLLRKMADEMKGEAVPEHIAEVARQAALRTIREIDCWWAPSLVRQFHEPSRRLGLGMDDPAFLEDLTETLMNRLRHDIVHEAIEASPQRIRGIRDCFRIVGAKFTDEHAQRVTDFLYERCLIILKFGTEDLAATMEETERLVDRFSGKPAL